MTAEQQPTVSFTRLHPGATPPAFGHPGDAGADLSTVEAFSLAPGERHTAATGIAIALPAGWAAFVHPRSGLAARHGITVLNGPGTIDEGYRGEIKVPLVNLDPRETMEFHPGDRIAQLVFQRVESPELIEVDELPGATSRGTGGFGSTGGFTSNGTQSGRTQTGQAQTAQM
ncbi:dUTP diphosphatase [Sediminivirga luteola]|uniref:dUTP diphosphatase n=1 Tax=Sediminivirga luteola TaxID=1774748 RepID=UPI001E50C0B5|nr:dUTP diphosphatase [Sediminivirga luteola]MCI2266195.1 dUTP diphosphatase [Sediminivirga luteola]